MDLAEADVERMLRAALEARRRAYAPYSDFLVGAALLGRGGEIFAGCNVENASYGAVICAERTAMVTAVAQGRQDFTALVVCGDNGPTPCGLCCQVLIEFVDDMPVLCHDTRTNQFATRTTLRQLAPIRFRLPKT